MSKQLPALDVQATDALAKLRSGNQRFVDADRCMDAYLRQTQLEEHVEGQAPFAIILGCSDSRVPVEIVFDIGLGVAFVIRIAGNIVTPTIIGSVEFAAVNFGARLIVVLGHTGCGAVTATVKNTHSEDAELSENIGTIVDWIRPSVDRVREDKPGVSEKELIDQVVRSNVCAATDRLRRNSTLLKKLIREDGLVVVGAEYSLKTGAVEFFDGV